MPKGQNSSQKFGKKKAEEPQQSGWIEVENPQQQPQQAQSQPQQRKNQRKMKQSQKQQERPNFSNLTLDQQKIVKRIEDNVKEFKPKHLKPLKVSQDHQFPFWAKNVVPEQEVNKEQFIPGKRLENDLRKQFIKKGAKMISVVNQNITRKIVPLHRITPVPPVDTAVLMALRACRGKHFRLIHNDIENMKRMAKKENQNFSDFFDIDESKIEIQLFSDTSTVAMALKVYAQVFNCSITTHHKCFPDPSATTYTPSWDVKQRQFVDKNGKVIKKKPWICHILIVDEGCFAIKIKNLKESTKLTGKYFDEREYYVPIDYLEESDRWIKEYRTYCDKLEIQVGLVDAQKSIPNSILLDMAMLQPTEYFKKNDRKETKEKIQNMQKTMDQCGLKVKVDTFAGYKQLKSFVKQVVADKNNFEKVKPNSQYVCNIKPPKEVKVSKTQKKQMELEKQIQVLKERIDELSAQSKMWEQKYNDERKNQTQGIEVEQQQKQSPKKLKAEKSQMKEEQKQMQIQQQQPQPKQGKK